MKFSIVATILFSSLSALAKDTFQLPFSGTWFVMQAGDTPNVNHHMQVISQAYGMDLAKVGGTGNRAVNSGSGSQTKDYFSWGENVLAPVEGTIVAVENSLPDNEIGVHDTNHPLGNHVVIKTADGSYIFLAHFQKDSVIVTVGAKVKAAAALGKCGNSGNSDFPHIHMHVQNTSDFNNGVGQNISFSNINVELSGKKFEKVEWPLIRGLFISNFYPSSR